MRNTGKSSEVFFEDWVKCNQHNSLVYRFKDSSDFAKSSGGRGAVMSKNNPADYAGVVMGKPCFVDVKSSINKISFPKANAKDKFQRQAGLRCTKLGLTYYYFIHNLNNREGYLIDFETFWSLEDTKWGTIRNNSHIVIKEST